VSRELSPDYDLEIYLNGENVLTNTFRQPALRNILHHRKAGDVAVTNE